MRRPGGGNASALDVPRLTPLRSRLGTSPGPDARVRPLSGGCGDAGQLERLRTVAALRPLGFSVAELDDLLAIMEELDDGWVASAAYGYLLAELERFCVRVESFEPATERPEGQALAALRSRHDQLAATADCFPW